MILIHTSHNSLPHTDERRTKLFRHPALIRLHIGVASLFILLITLCCTKTLKAQTIQPPGKALFENKCAKCHGNDGTKGRWGAKNLHISKLNDDELFRTISTGKGFMPKWSKKLTQAQILIVIEYIKTLRK
ncbi:cytochrome c [Mucilaginibacter sabulilitoris]|uniref:Cytochrome c n=1 Tax=Mucilaginibacter sabulilitoris TaxID=1173583 RepID=A0ABZ0THG9_9SPHI|nr:cytochrome c [Mucilaginibacter sabulilitoris]WPU91159.1 cytochrome c [Mucilaginibacter sabulilitoris]